jgi:hypothetical protein
VIEIVQEEIGEVPRKPEKEPKHFPDINRFVVKVIRDIDKASDNILWISKNIGHLSKGKKISFTNVVRNLNILLENIIRNSEERNQGNS